MSSTIEQGLILLCLSYLLLCCLLVLQKDESKRKNNLKVASKLVDMILAVLATTSPLVGCLAYLFDRPLLGLEQVPGAFWAFIPLYLILPPVAAAVGVLFGKLMGPSKD